jgi:hypothetical protein
VEVVLKMSDAFAAKQKCRSGLFMNFERKRTVRDCNGILFCEKI